MWPHVTSERLKEVSYKFLDEILQPIIADIKLWKILRF